MVDGDGEISWLTFEKTAMHVHAPGVVSQLTDEPDSSNVQQGNGIKTKNKTAS